MVAATTTTVTGLDPAQLDQYETQAETAMTTALNTVMKTIADYIRRETITAAALTAASPDDLSAIPSLWTEQVDNLLLPLTGQVYWDAAGTLHSRLITAADMPIPPVSSMAAETYLAGARNTFQEVGADLWETARNELLDGLQAGEPIPQLAARLEQSAGLTGRTATMVARTQVLDASNAGSYDTATASGLDLLKGWEATPDFRTRETHLAAGARYSGPGMIPMGEAFMVGGWAAQRPHDPELPPEERYSCRCTTVYATRVPDHDPRKEYLATLKAAHERKLAQIKTAHATRVAKIDAQTAVKEAAVETADVDRAAKLAALRTSHDLRVAQLREAYERRRAQLVANHERVLRDAKRGPTQRPLPSEPAPTPAPGPVTRPVLEGPIPVEVRPELADAGNATTIRRAVIRQQNTARERAGIAEPLPSQRIRFPSDGDVQTAQEHAEGLLRGVDQFPAVPIDVSYGSMANYAETHGGTRIVFSSEFARDRNAYLASLREGATPDMDGLVWHPPATASPQGVALHEFGHALNEFVGKQDVAALVERVVADLAAERGVPVADLIRAELGQYAASNMDELIAEAFADAMIAGDQASVLSQRIYALLVDQYRVRTGKRAAGEVVLPVPRRPLPSKPAPPMDGAEFDRRVAAAAKGDQATDLPPTRVTVDASSGSDVGKWKAVTVEGPGSEAPKPLLSAVNARVRVSGNANSWLRTPNGPAAPSPWEAQAWKRTATAGQREVRALDKAMSESKLPSDAVVWRGMNPGRVGLPAGDATGFEWTDVGYVGTSATRSVAEDSFGARGALLRILAPEGTPAISIEGGGEAEILLGRGLRFRVVADRGLVGKIRHLDVEIIPAASAEPVTFTPLGRGIGEIVTAIETDPTITVGRILAMLEGNPELRKAAAVAKRATDVDKVKAGLLRLAARENVAVPNARQLKTIAAAERKAAAAAKREAAAVKRAQVEAAKVEKARAAKVKADVKAVESGDFATLTRVGPQAGSHAGGVFEDAAGNRWYVKQAPSEEFARSESLALALYRAAGLDAPDMVVGGGAPGLRGVQVATRLLPDAANLDAFLSDPLVLAEVRKGFGVDALLGNWDVMGAGFDNIVVVNGQAWRVDAGGALRFRALGGSKAEAFGPRVSEWDTLRDLARSPNGARVFGDMSSAELEAALKRVRALTPAKIEKLVKAAGLDDDLAQLLIARRKDMMTRIAGTLKTKDPKIAFREALKTALKGRDALNAPTARFGRFGGSGGFGGGVPDPIAVTRYRGVDYQNINSVLRNGDAGALRYGVARVDVDRWISELDAILESSPLSNDLVVYRSLKSGQSIFGDALAGDVTGVEWSDSAFVSTTATQERAEQFIGNFTGRGWVVLRIVVPRGTHAAALSSYDREAEILLERGLRFRVVADRGKDARGVRMLDVMVVGKG